MIGGRWPISEIGPGGMSIPSYGYFWSITCQALTEGPAGSDHLGLCACSNAVGDAVFGLYQDLVPL